MAVRERVFYPIKKVLESFFFMCLQSIIRRKKDVKSILKWFLNVNITSRILNFNQNYVKVHQYGKYIEYLKRDERDLLLHSIIQIIYYELSGYIALLLRLLTSP